MKRYAYYLLIMAAAAMVACEAEPVNNSDPELQNGTYIYTINASIPEEVSNPDQVAVKSDYDASGHFSWSSGDAISVLFHNGDDNKFFTLTTTGTGSAASFSGEIETGYEIGASDGTVSDKKIWVLFPASSNHRYVAGDSKPARFYMNPRTDFTAAGAYFSANMPMYDLLTDEGDISFKNLAVGYKFTFTNIDDSISKILVSIENQSLGSSWYALSGEIKVNTGGYLDHAGASSVAQATLTYITNVDASSHTATIYVPFRYYAAGFKPIVTVKDYSTGNIIKTVTATAANGITTMGKIQPITLSTPGTGSFASKFGISWYTDPNVVSADGDGVAYNVIKGIADESFLYVLLGVKKSRLTINPNYYRANSVNYKFAGTSGYFGFLYQDGIPMINDAGSAVPDSQVTETDEYVYYEMKCSRALGKFSGTLNEAGSKTIQFCIFYNTYKADSSSDTVADWSNYVYSPTITVTLPTYADPA